MIFVANVVKKRRQPIDCPRFFDFFCSFYLRPELEPLRVLLELEEFLVELLPLLVPLGRLLLLELFTRLLELLPERVLELLVPLGRLLLLELFTRPLVLPVLPVRPLVPELVEVPLLIFGRVLVPPLPMRPLDEPPLLTFGRLLSELPLLGAGGLLPLFEAPLL